MSAIPPFVFLDTFRSLVEAACGYAPPKRDVLMKAAKAFTCQWASETEEVRETVARTLLLVELPRFESLAFISHDVLCAFQTLAQGTRLNAVFPIDLAAAAIAFTLQSVVEAEGEERNLTLLRDLEQRLIDKLSKPVPFSLSVDPSWSQWGRSEIP